MKRKFTALVLLVTILVTAGLVLGCGKSDKDNGTSGKDHDKGTVTSQSEELGVGEEFKVELESNPTTGYDWKMTTTPDPDILGLTQDSYDPPESSAMGAPGTRVWRFQALNAGSTTIVFEYARSWESDTPPAQTHNVSVVVR